MNFTYTYLNGSQVIDYANDVWVHPPPPVVEEDEEDEEEEPEPEVLPANPFASRIPQPEAEEE